MLIFGAIVLTVALNVSLADVSSLGDLKLPFGAAIPMARTFAWALAPACALSALGLALLVSPISAAQIAFAGAVVVAVGLEFAAIRLGEPAFASGVLALILAAFGLAALGRELQAHGAPSWSRAPLWVAATVFAILLFPVLLRDPAPIRTALASIFAAGALAAAYAAYVFAASGEPFEVTAWEGGLGGGQHGLKASKPVAATALALVFAAASVGSFASRAPAESPARTGAPAGKSEPGGETPAKAPKPPRPPEASSSGVPMGEK